MGKKLSLNKAVTAIFFASAVLGYVISVGKLYLFHVIGLIWCFLVLLGYIRIYKTSFKITIPFLLIVTFASVSLLWTPSLLNGLDFIFYFLNAFLIVFVLINYSQTLDDLYFIFRVLAFFFLLNFFVGLIETTGFFRLPMSQYHGLNMTNPSGFNSNINNFGFVFLAIFPYIYLFPRKAAKAISTVLAVWFAFSLESKGFFFGLLSFYFFYFLIKIKKKKTWILLVGLGISALFGGGLINTINVNLDVDNRVFSTFSQIERGIELIKDKNVDVADSTGLRSYMYGYGIQKLIESKGLGIGVAGIGSKLVEDSNIFGEDSKIYSFHNFFLEMLIDFGVIPFIFLMLGYFLLIIRLSVVSEKFENCNLGYFTQASALSLLTILPASISPSSIIYVFTFWIIIGFSLSSLSVAKRVYNEKYSENLFKD